MMPADRQVTGAAVRLSDAVRLASDKVLNPGVLATWKETRPSTPPSDIPAPTDCDGIRGDGAARRLDGSDTPVLVVLAAGKGTRFGVAPKCIQPVRSLPLARHTIDAFRQLGAPRVVCLVGYEHERVAQALGPDNVYVLSEQPAGGTAFAAYEALCVPELRESNPLLIITMGDRIVPGSVFQRLLVTHRSSPDEADLTLLSALYLPPRQRGRGRVVRDPAGRVERIIEQRDIDAVADPDTRRQLEDLVEGNCPLYAVRAATLARCLAPLTNANAQSQYYLTDLIAAVSQDGGTLRTVTTSPTEPEYAVLCADVTRPDDLGRLEAALEQAEILGGDPSRSAGPPPEADTVSRVAAGRPTGQVAAIARQLEALGDWVRQQNLGFAPDQPVAIGIAGGRMRLAFMHPDMGRFFGPAWQMPIGAGHAEGQEQIVLLMQAAADGHLHLHPLEAKYHERIRSVPADLEAMYPDPSVTDATTYEAFGTRMSEVLLRRLGYLTDEEIRQQLERGEGPPPVDRRLSSSLRRPWPLVANALASFRTLRAGELGERVQARLGRPQFQGLRIVSTGSIPEGGFSSSSAVTVATLNALDALHGFGAAPEVLVRLACQAEYGTGVRAGSLDQATEQTGQAGRGTLISSNPRDGYRVLDAFPVPTDRFHILFPYSVARDREAWRWSWDAYAEIPAPGRLTAVEIRKMTGKAAEIAAVLTRLPLEMDFFPAIQDDLVQHGTLGPDRARWVASVLRQLPLFVPQAELRERLDASREWLADQMLRGERLDPALARERAESQLTSLLAGWRDPTLRRTTPAGDIVAETGMPLRATVAYLFAEVIKNFRLIRHPEEWIACVRASQRGDRWVDLDPQVLPTREAMETELPWEAGVRGPARLELWLDRFGATPFDFNRGLEDAALEAPEPPAFHQLAGSNFFRGLALIDLVEAMLDRAFGTDAVAVRINAAGQGDYFQVHVDRERAEVEAVKEFIRRAFYQRFELAPPQEFVEVHSGGGAVGVRLDRFDALPEWVRQLQAQSS